MAISTTPLTSQFIDVLAVDTVLNNTGFLDIKAGPATLYAISIQNGHGAAVYVKLYDTRAATASTVPHMNLMVPASITRNFVITDGLAFSTGISARCVTESGTGGTTNPGSPVITRLWLG